MGVELYSPLPAPSAEADNPAIREDPSQPVAAEDVERLPINAQSKRLDKSAFVYNEEEDTYYCPDGRRMEYEETKGETRRGQWTERRVYRSSDCEGCPLRDLCLKDKTTKRRSISRDVHEKRRQEHAAKMATEEAKARYAKRFHFAEVPFAILKHVFGLRRFLLRGLEKVTTEWLWACTAYNVFKLIRALAKLRAEVAQVA